MVVDEGVTFVRDRVLDLETLDRKVLSAQTESGASFTSPHGSLTLPGLGPR